MTARASAGSPIDFVSAAGLVRVTQDLISLDNFTCIEFGADYEVVRAAEGNRGDRVSGRRARRSQLTKPSVLWSVFYLFTEELTFL
jgi:hypothetical protein